VNDVVAENLNIASISIGKNSYIALYFRPTFGFQIKSQTYTTNSSGIAAYATSTLNSATFQIYMGTTLISTQTIYPNYSHNWYANPATSGTSTSLQTSNSYKVTGDDIEIYQGFIPSDTIFYIYASHTETKTGTATTSNGSYNCSSSGSKFSFNSSSTYSQFIFQNGIPYTSEFTSGGLSCNEVYSNLVSLSQINSQNMNCSNAISCKNMTVSTAMTCPLLTLTNPPIITASNSYMMLGGSNINCNISGGGSNSLVALPNSGFFLVIISSSKSSDETQAFFNMISYGGVSLSTKIITISNSANGNFFTMNGLTTGQFTFQISASSSITNFSWYYMQLF
jgi:hypothetical protein